MIAKIDARSIFWRHDPFIQRDFDCHDAPRQFFRIERNMIFLVHMLRLPCVVQENEYNDNRYGNRQAFVEEAFNHLRSASIS